MSDKDIKKQCKAINSAFVTTLQEDVEAAAFMLGNLYRYREEASKSDISLISDTLRELKKTLNKAHIQKLWCGMHAFHPDRWQVIDKETKLSLYALKRGILQDPELLEALDSASLISLGQNPLWYRETLLAIIRQYLITNRHPDPFVAPHFSYDLLFQGGPEQNYLYMGQFIRQCPGLPVDLIGQLGRASTQMGKFILLDCQSHEQYFEISYHFIENDGLRTEIAKSWKSYLESYPLSPSQKAFLQMHLPRLQSQYPEFKEVELNARIKRHYVAAPFDFPSLFTPQMFDVASLAVMAPPALYFSSSILAHGASIVSLATGLAAGAGSATLSTLALGVLSTAPQVVLPLVLYTALAYKAESWFKQKDDSKVSPSMRH